MKKIFLIITLLLLCGCSAKYTLTVDDEKISEEIVFPIDKNKIREQDEYALDMDLYSIDSIENILKNNIYVEDNSKKYIYDKVVTDEPNQYLVTLTHEYEKNRLINSRVLNECFENTEIEESKDGLKIKLSGKFYCYADDTDSINFTVSTNNVVKSASVKYNMFTNEYIWKIDRSNRDFVDIDIQILYQSKSKHYGLKIAAIVIGILVLVGIAFISKKLFDRKKTNEI